MVHAFDSDKTEGLVQHGWIEDGGLPFGGALSDMCISLVSIAGDCARTGMVVDSSMKPNSKAMRSLCV